jgi:hypothetical protein
MSSGISMKAHLVQTYCIQAAGAAARPEPISPEISEFPPSASSLFPVGSSLASENRVYFNSAQLFGVKRVTSSGSCPSCAARIVFTCHYQGVSHAEWPKNQHA